MNESRNNQKYLQSGQALVEFALVIGILLFLLMGMLVVGYWMSAVQAVTVAAREGARQASLTLDNGLTEEAVKTALKGFDPGGSKTSVEIIPGDSWSSARVRGNFITVSVRYTLPFSFGFFEGHFAGSSPFTQVSSASSSRIECVPLVGQLTCPAGKY